MRFQKDISYPYPRPPRGPGRGDPPYRMSRSAYQARLQNLVGVKRQRTYEETRRIELEVALWTHQPEPKRESLRALAGRLRCSHVYCWKIARKYRRGLIPMLPPDEQGLVAMRDSLDHDPATERHAASGDAAVPAQFAKVPWAWTRQWCSEDEIWASMLLTQEQKTMLAAEFDRREYARQQRGEIGPRPLPEAEPFKIDERPATPHQPAEPEPQHRVGRSFQELIELLNGTGGSSSGSGRRTVSSVSPWLRPARKLDWD